MTHKILPELTFKGYESTRTKRWAGAIELGKQGSRVVVIHLTDSKSWIWSQGWVQPASVHYRILQRPSHWQYQLPLRMRLKTKEPLPYCSLLTASHSPHRWAVLPTRGGKAECVWACRFQRLREQEVITENKWYRKTYMHTGTVVFNLWTQDSSLYSDWAYFLN